jgi:hypothetical protein
LIFVAVGTLVYAYERYYRGPGESALYGTWLDPTWPSDEPTYLELHPDHTFVFVELIRGERTPLVEGKWYAGGPNIYFRFPAEFFGPSRPTVLHIVDISPEQFTVRFSRHGQVYRFQRTVLDSPRASNQAMERTATSPAFTFSVTSLPPLRAAHSPGGRRSSFSR